MIKINFIIAFFLFGLVGCGYEPIYSSKNINFTIQDIEKENTQLNNEFERIFMALASNENENKLTIKIDSTKQTSIKSKDTKGNPLKYELNIVLTIKVLNSINKVERTFEESTSYDNDNDKFRLSNYKEELEELLIRRLAEKAFKYLTNIS